MQDTTHPQALPAGFKLLWYEIRSLLGQGGFGITYLAQDPNLDQLVAIKEYLPSAFAVRGGDGGVIPSAPDAEQDFRWGLQRFIDEGRTLARFDHPGIVRVHSVFEQNGTAYLVMRYEQGEPMSALLEREKFLPEDRLKRILLEVIDGLEQVHEGGFIHRDIKPANIYLRENGSAVLIDFGAARQALGMHTQTLTTIVSPGYAPFEQYYSDGTPQGPWTDIYALGATAYRAVAGRAPLAAVDRSKGILNGTSDSVVSAVEIGRDRYSPAFLYAIDRALAFREQDRPQTLSAWRDLINRTSVVDQRIDEDIVAEAATVPLSMDPSESPTEIVPAAAESPPPETRRRWYRKKRYLIPLAVVVLLILAGEDESDRPSSPPEEPAPETTTLTLEAVTDDTPPQEPADNVAELLHGARSDIDALRLTTPPGNNAWQKYREVLALDPDNAAANAGLHEIVRRYVTLATDAAKDDDLPRARQYLERAALVDPDDPMLKRAQEYLARREEAQSLAATIAAHTDQISDKKTRRKVNEARKALSKQEYGKALQLLRDVAKQYK
jgi:serine/threonine protein kinase